MKKEKTSCIKETDKSRLDSKQKPRRDIEIKTYEFEIWSSLDQKYITISIEAGSKEEAIKAFQRMHPHKKYRILEGKLD